MRSWSPREDGLWGEPGGGAISGEEEPRYASPRSPCLHMASVQ